ncbi:MAG: hypothetical protein ACYTGX_06915 [Planctomycetota bacterium]|jgi:tetratricopeptide (TPR) repeat protein
MKRIWAVVLAGLAGCGGGPEYADEPLDGGGDAPRVENGPDVPAPAVERARPSDEAIRQAIRELGAAKKRTRDLAQEKLIVMGADAVAAMRDAREATADPERAMRLDTVLRVLGEEGAYTEGIDRLLEQRYDEAAAKLRRYLEFGRGRYKAQAEYLVLQANGLEQWQAGNRPLTGQSLRTDLDAPGLWEYATFFHNVYLFFLRRDLDARVFYEEARDLYTLATERDAGYRRAWACRAALLATGGEAADAEQSFEQALALPRSTAWDLMDVALYHLAAGRRDRALDTLEQAIPACNAEREQAIRDGTPEDELYPEARWWCRESNDFDALKGDPRFEAIVRDR